MTDRLGTYIAQQRERLNLTQSQLADSAGVPRQTVNRLEQGVTKLPGAAIRRDLAAALGVRHIELLIAAGELTAEEADIQADTRSEAVRRLQPLIDSYEWNDAAIEAAAYMIRTVGDLYKGMLDTPDIK